MAPLWQLCSKGQLESVRRALRAGRDVNSKDGNNKTALIWAVNEKHNGIVGLLLEQPAIEVNNKDDEGWTALHGAVIENNVEALELLLANQQVDVNCKDNEGSTALQRAAIEMLRHCSSCWHISKWM